MPLAQVWTHYMEILNSIKFESSRPFQQHQRTFHDSFYLNWMVDIQVLSRPQLIFPYQT